MTYTETGCIKDCKDESHVLDSAGKKCVSDCVSDDHTVLSASNTECVTSCGSDILNYAKTACI